MRLSSGGERGVCCDAIGRDSRHFLELLVGLWRDLYGGLIV